MTIAPGIFENALIGWTARSSTAFAGTTGAFPLALRPARRVRRPGRAYCRESNAQPRGNPAGWRHPDGAVSNKKNRVSEKLGLFTAIIAKPPARGPLYRWVGFSGISAAGGRWSTLLIMTPRHPMPFHSSKVTEQLCGSPCTQLPSPAPSQGIQQAADDAAVGDQHERFAWMLGDQCRRIAQTCREGSGGFAVGRRKTGIGAPVSPEILVVDQVPEGAPFQLPDAEFANPDSLLVQSPRRRRWLPPCCGHAAAARHRSDRQACADAACQKCAAASTCSTPRR